MKKNKRYLLLSGLLLCTAGWANTLVIQVHIRNHLFYPSNISIPAHTKVKLMVFNDDATSEEFESYELNREKMIMGKHRAIIFIGPVNPGNYPFFGEFHPHTAQGKVIAR